MSTKQGIVTILGSDCEPNKAASIRRTLSADMSSMKWLQQNGFLSHVKNISLSQDLVAVPNNDSFSSSSSDEEGESDDVWRLTQSRQEPQKPSQLGVWGTLLTQKSQNSESNALPPYVHPLVRKSSSSMSEKSLEICTESLGSETGSDGFLSNGHDDDDDEENRQMVVHECIKDPSYLEDFHVVKYKRAPALPIPPPLSSISGGDSSSLRFHSHRGNGRLVLKAVVVPPRRYFHAQRGDGRLVLTLINSPTSQETKMEGDEEFESVFDTMEEADKNLDEKVDDNDEKVDGILEEKIPVADCSKEVGFFVEQNPSLPSKMINVHKSSLVMEKLMGLSNTNPRWSREFNKAGIFTDEEEEVARKEAMEEVPIPHSLPPRPPVARQISSSSPPPASATSSFNSYEYFWRSKSPVGATSSTNSKISKNPQATPFRNRIYNQNWRGCNKVPRSLTLWEPRSIATSG